MLVTCGECGGEISRYAIVCPHCGYGSGSGHAGEHSLENQEEDRKFWARIEKEKEIEAQRLAEEGRRREREQKEEERQRRKEKRQREGAIILVIMAIIFMGAVVGAVFGIKYLVLEIWRFISALF